MNRIGELIKKACPQGVEYKQLGEVGFLYNGLTGKTKSDFLNGNANYISYKNVFNNISVNINKLDSVNISPNEKQHKVEIGDVIFTASSENIEEAGMSSVLIEKFEPNLYLNSFCFGLRFNNNINFIPGFLKYMFRDMNIRKQIMRTVNGVTRFNISKKKFLQIIITIPPIEVQNQIVTILDLLNDNTNTLLQELKELRIKQYKYYLNELTNCQ